MKKYSRFAAALLALSLLPQPCLAAEYPFEETEASTLPRLERLVEECAQNGIDTSYEDINVQVIRDYIDYGKEIHKTDKSKARYVLESIERIADDTEKALRGYLEGKEQPKDYVKFTGGKVDIDGYSFTADTNLGKRPVFFMGYNNAAKDIEKLDKYGVNLIQTELGPYSCIFSPSSAKWKYSGKWSEDCRFGLNTNEAYSGASCLEINNLSGNDLTLYQDISLTAGSYTLKYYAKSQNACSGGIQYGTPDNLKVVKNLSSVSENWTSNSYNFVVRQTQTVRIAINVAAAEKLLIDEMTIKSGGTDFIEQGGFENDFCYFVPANDETRGIGTDYAVSFERYRREIEPVFDTAAEKNIKVDFIISPHYFPQFLKNQGADVAFNTDFNTFLKFDIYSDIAKSAITEYLKLILPEITKKESLFAICITNEPKYQIAYIDGFFDKHPDIKEKWIGYLRGRYENIEELNEAYGKNYADFSDVELSLDEKNAQYYDTMVFNADMLSEWHSWLAGVVREYAPGVPIHTKQMKHIADGHGMSAERAVLGGYADLGGNDAYNLYKTNIDDLSTKLFWYDFVASFAKAPVFNSENHLICDTGKGVSPYRKEVARHVRADLWQGAIHSRSASVLWAWEKSFDTSNIFYDSFGTRPDAVAEVGRTTLDLNRLSDVVAAFQDTESNVGILYSEASAIYESSYEGDLNKTYRKLNESGQKVTFVSEGQMQKGCNAKILVIPKYTNYVDEKTVEAINSYIADGGCVIAYENCLLYNTKKQANGVELSDGAVLTDENADIADSYFDKLTSLGLDTISVSENGARTSGVDWKSTLKDGKLYINLCNESFSEKFVSVRAEGSQQEYAKDLLTGEYVNPSDVQLLPFMPVLLEFGEVSDDFIRGFLAKAENTSCTFSWQNSTFSEKRFELWDGSGNLIYSAGLDAQASEISVSKLSAGCEYKAVITDGEQKKEKIFMTKRNKNTSSLIKGWTLEYRGNDPYIFDEGEFAVVSDESHGGNSSLRLKMFNPRQSYAYYQLWRDVYLQKGKTYRYTVWYKTDGYGTEWNATTKFSVYANDRSNGIDEVIRTNAGMWNKKEGEWHSVSFDFTPTATKNYRFSLIADCGGTIWLDDISIYQTSNGGITGENLLKKTSSKIGGDFEDDSYCTIPSPIENISGEFLGKNELRFSWDTSDDIKKVNVYREENGESVLVSSTQNDGVSVYSAPYENWRYSFTAVDANENESEPVILSGENMGNVSKPEFYSDGVKTEFLKSGRLSVKAYAYEDAELFIAVYDNGRLEAVSSASGKGLLSAETEVLEEGLQNKSAAAYVWHDGKPLREKCEILPISAAE